MAEQGKIRLEIVTPYGIFYEGDVDSVTVRVKDGEMGIMSMHTPLIAALVPGETRMLEQGVWRHCLTTNGYAEIGNDLVMVIVSAAEWPEDIDVPRAREALKRAAARYETNRGNPPQATRDRHAMERAQARLQIAEKHAPGGDASGASAR